LAAGAGAAWAFGPQIRKSFSSDDARKLLGLAASLVSSLPAATPQRARLVRAARKTSPIRRSRTRKRAA
jgi:hypothetical protein